MIVADTHQDPRWVVMEDTKYVRSWLAVPIVAGGRLIGYYSFDKSVTGFFTEEHARLAESLAAQAAVAIQNARLFEERLKADRDLSAAQEKFSKAFYSHPNPMVISTLDGTRLLDANDSYLRFFDCTREEILGGKAQAFQFYAEPGVRERLAAKIIAEGKITEERVQLRTKT
jgi:PAS domain-containing protein